jgi:hypothetical protein
VNAFCDVVLGRVCPILFKFCILESWCDIYVIINIEYVFFAGGATVDFSQAWILLVLFCNNLWNQIVEIEICGNSLRGWNSVWGISFLNYFFLEKIVICAEFPTEFGSSRCEGPFQAPRVHCSHQGFVMELMWELVKTSAKPCVGKWSIVGEWNKLLAKSKSKCHSPNM